MKFAVAVVATAAAVSPDFEYYKAKFDKSYESPAAEARARECWEQNIADLPAMSTDEVRFDENVFSDQCLSDFNAVRLDESWSQSNGRCTGSGATPYDTPADETMAVDWRSQGYVNPIKDQGSCGSCWAFSAVGALEAAHFKTSGELLSFSEQDLVSCDRADGNAGCSGGMPGEAMQWVAANGIALEADYPYTASDDACDNSRPKSSARFSGFVWLDTTAAGGREPVLLAALQNEGPVSIAVLANVWHQYSGGIMDSSICPSGGINHAVLAVGFGTAGGKKYWIVRNSWGTGWGEEGYIRLAYGENTCSIQSCFSALPAAAAPTPPPPPSPPTPPPEHCSNIGVDQASCKGVDQTGAACVWCPAVNSCMDQATFDKLILCSGGAIV